MIVYITRRGVFLGGALVAFGAGRARAEAAPRITVLKSPTCGCCAAWVAHMRDAGFRVRTRDVDQATLSRAKARAGIAPDLSGCHTARVEGYVVEGHVPAADVARLLRERPDAIGVTVPGMPIGSPGMEMGDTREAYETLLIGRDGRTTVFARHG